MEQVPEGHRKTRDVAEVPKQLESLAGQLGHKQDDKVRIMQDSETMFRAHGSNDPYTKAFSWWVWPIYRLIVPDLRCRATRGRYTLTRLGIRRVDMHPAQQPRAQSAPYVVVEAPRIRSSLSTST